MRNLIVSVICVAMSVAGLGGCSRQASTQAKMARQLTSALTIMNNANRGYTAKTQSQKLGTPLQQYRQQTLETAIPLLKQVVQSGDKQQQVTAATLLAQIEASRARYLARQAEGQYGQLQAQSGVLVSEAVGVDRASGRSRLFEVDNNAAVTKLQHTLKQLRQRQTALQKSIQNEQKAQQQQKNQSATLQHKSNQLMQQAQNVHQQGFVANGNKQYALYDQAGKIKAQAADASFDAERHQVTAQVHANHLRLLRARHKLVDTAIAMVQKRIAELQHQQKQMDQGLQQAKQQKQQTVQTLRQEFKQLAAAYQKSTAGPFAKAEKHIGQAITLLKTARTRAGNQDQQNVELNLLSCYLDQVHIALNDAQAARGYGDLVALVATGARKEMPMQAGALQQALKKARQQQKTLSQKAASAIDAGQKLAQTLSSMPKPIGTIATRQQAILSQSQQQVQQLATN